MLKRFAWMALFACAPLYAAPHLDDQRLQQLANDPFWISLGHYETAKLGGWRSYISDKKFFLEVHLSILFFYLDFNYYLFSSFIICKIIVYMLKS